MQIAIDVGYSCVKAVTQDGRVIIPSVVSSHRELILADLSRNGTGHIVEIRKQDGTTGRYFVGELALREGHAASFTLDREKHRHPNHDILVYTAARILEAGMNATLAAGLPVAYYRAQREELRRHLEGLQAEVSVNGGNAETVSFRKVIVYPQGAGALLTAPNLPASGLVLLVDPGQKTTEYVTAEVAGGLVKPVSSLCGSIELGVHTVHEAVAAEFQARTGAPLAAVRVPEVIAGDGRTCYYGKEIDLSRALEKARADVALAIADQVQSALGDRYAFVRRIYLAGGGALALPSLAEMFPGAQILPEPQWANATGFLKVLSDISQV
ncbi:MAG: ParM/StbA family protein [Pelotomaculum sp.]|nr:ParM/StbA family protein [Pelotomaculum sp.]